MTRAEGARCRLDEGAAQERRRKTAPSGAPEAQSRPCITCSDQAVEVTVLLMCDGGFAVVDTGQGEEEVSVALVSAAPGDRILVHAGEAIAVVGR